MDIKAVIEIPKGSEYKYEIKNGILVLDRTLNQKIPANYGYFPGTLAPDKDALDVFIASNSPIEPFSEVSVEIIGGYKCVDSRVSDDKLIAIITGDDYYINFNSIKQYLETYKDGFQVINLLSKDEALKVYEKAKDVR